MSEARKATAGKAAPRKASVAKAAPRQATAVKKTPTPTPDPAPALREALDWAVREAFPGAMMLNAHKAVGRANVSEEARELLLDLVARSRPH